MEAKGHEAPPSPANAEAAPPAVTPPEPPRRRAGAPKRKANLNFSSPSTTTSPAPKRLAKERNALHPLPPILHNGPVTRARQSPNKLAVAALQNPPYPSQAPATAADPLASTAGDRVEAEEVPPEEPLVDAEFEAVRSRGSNVHAVPTPAGWFSWKTIHPIEKHTMTSFFSGKSENRTSDIYMEIRNSIMKKFHADPQTPVELKDLSELSAGDMDARQEVMEFLDHWGLINFHPFPPSNSDVSNSDANGVAEASSLFEKLYQFKTVQPVPRLVPKKAESSAPAMPSPALLPESAIAEDLVRPMGPSVEYHCNSCSADCSRKRYHCQKQADFDLCTECYNAGKFGSGMAAADFILMEPADIPGVSGGSWTDQETLLLLEALELFGENWNEIAEHVATKTKTQCMLHFIQMPIEDPFLAGKNEDDDNAQENKDPVLVNKESASLNAPETKEIENAADADQPMSSLTDDSKRKDSGEIEGSCKTGTGIAIDALKAAFQAVGYFPEHGGLLSFAEAGNPVMALAAFLVGLVEPGVATTSIRSSLKAMSEDSPGIQLATRHCFLLEDPPHDRNDLSFSEREAQKEDQVQMSNGIDESKDCIESTEKSKDCIESTEKSKDCIDTTEKSKDCIDTTEKSKDYIDTTEKSKDYIDTTEKSKDCIDTSEKSKDCIDNTEKSKDCIDNTVKHVVSVEKEIEPPNSSQDCLQKSPDEKELCDSVPPSEATPSSTKDCDQPSEGEPIVPTAVNDACGHDLPMVPTPSNTKEPGDFALQRGETVNDVKEINDFEMAEEEKPNSVKKLEDASNTADTMLTSAPVEGQESQHTASNGLTVKNGEKAGGDDKKTSPNDDEKNNNSTATNGEHDMNKIKCAAVTALSAAAVKAKFLANQEEDQIRQLVSLVIEKQLHKLETKLALFTETENVVMRMREQIDRSRQRLLHERAQIVAARLGLPASSLPTNKVALGYGSTVLRPPNMASLKPPPIRRP